MFGVIPSQWITDMALLEFLVGMGMGMLFTYNVQYGIPILIADAFKI